MLLLLHVTITWFATWMLLYFLAYSSHTSSNIYIHTFLKYIVVLSKLHACLSKKNISHYFSCDGCTELSHQYSNNEENITAVFVILQSGKCKATLHALIFKTFVL